MPTHNSTVTLVRCPSYAPADLAPALDRTLELLGGLDRYVGRGDRVLVKPNIICGRYGGRRPCQTHALFIADVLGRLVDLGAKPFVSDGPAWGNIENNCRWIGLTPLARRLGVPIVPMDRTRHVKGKHTQVFRTLAISSRALDADKIVNLPKFKSHVQLYLTIGVKNMFGCVVGRRKALWHLHTGDEKNYFAWMLVELFDTLKPVLTLVDAVTAMQGRGPTGGTAYPLGTIIGGTDAVAIDRVGCELVSGFPSKMRTLAAARDLGIGQPEMAKIDIAGDALADLQATDFEFARLMPIGFTLPRIVKGAVKQSWLSTVGH